MIETTALYTRRQTVFLLNARLGFDYDWHHMLMLWSTKDHTGYSIARSGIRLFPHSTSPTRAPLYLPADLAKFIADVKAKFPEMARPFSLKPGLYDVDTTTPPTFMRALIHRFRKAKPAIPAVA